MPNRNIGGSRNDLSGLNAPRFNIVAILGTTISPYLFFWQTPLVPEQASTRRYLTWLLAFLVWWSFLTGHVLNNIKGIPL